MNEVEVFNFEANEVRTVLIDEEVWLVGKDIAKSLGYADLNKAVAMHVDDEDKRTLSYKAYDKTPQALWKGNDYSNKTLINQSGVISLALSSKLPSARKFKRWVTSEVIPSVLKHGSYQVKEMTNDEIVGQALRIEHDRAERLAVELSVTKPKAEMNDLFLEKGQAIGIREASKEMNVKQNDLIDNLMNNGYVYRSSGHHGKLQPYKKYVPKYFVLKSASVNSVEFTPQMLITPQGREFFYKKFYAPDQIEMTL